MQHYLFYVILCNIWHQEGKCLWNFHTEPEKMKANDPGNVKGLWTKRGRKYNLNAKNKLWSTKLKIFARAPRLEGISCKLKTTRAWKFYEENKNIMLKDS